jgi:hypothetical protein
MSSERLIRAYCPTHKTGTTAPAAPVVLCESGDHALSQNFPNAEFWEYCCDCQSFCPSEIATSGEAQENCMVCGRRLARRFLCDHCQVISIESDEVSKRRKPYVVNGTGAVEPECPGCLRADGPPVRARAHACRAVNATISTPREVCPFCNEPVSPRPAPVAAVTTPLAPSEADAAVRRCVNCGAPAPNEFCSKCGASQTPPDVLDFGDHTPHDTAPIFNAADAKPVTPMSPPVTPATTGGSSSKGVFIGLAVFVGLVAVVAVAISLTTRVSGSNSNMGGYSARNSNTENTESLLERAISQGNLVQPLGASAKDYYDQLVREGASPVKLGSLRDRLVPALKTKPMKMLSDFYTPGSPTPLREEWDEAARMLNWASQMAPNDSNLAARAAYCTGRLDYIDKDKDGARRFWQRAVELDGSWALPHVGIGITYNDDGKYSTAIPYFEEAIRLDTSWAVPYHNLGSSYRGLKDYVTARSYYKRAVALAPHWGLPHVRQGDMAMSLNDCVTAAEEYKAVLDVVTPGTRGWDLAEINRLFENAQAGRGCY